YSGGDNWAHIDLPLYAAPEDEFENITERLSLEKAMLDGLEQFATARAKDESYEPQEWKDLDHIAMATRSGEWRDSDPEAVANWFRDRIEEHGEQLRRVCRYLKAWRDVHWDTGGPTSVSIMIAVAQNFVAQPGRDDLVTEAAAKHLGVVFRGEIREAGIDDEKEDFNRLEGSDRATAARRFAELGTAIHECRMMREHQKGQAVAQMKAQFGSRMPWDTSLIEVGSDLDSIRNDIPEKVVPPVVLSSSAG
ncbi:CBASS cGAMP synthase, partial [Pseudomonas coronafaciens]